jgi:hypothetical protein
MTQALTDASESWIDPIFEAVVSVFQRTGYFDGVNQYEPKRKPGRGLRAAVWFQSMRGVGAISGLAATSALVIFIGRIYINMLTESDEVDPNLMRAASNVMRELHGNYDFGLDPPVRNVDLLGETGTQLQADAGYLEQDRTKYRVIDITIPVIVNDVWAQA